MSAESYSERALREFPKIGRLVDADEGPYTVLGEFALYLRDGICDKSLSPTECERAFHILNEMGASEDVEVKNQLVVAVLEVLADYEETIEFSRSSLEGSALEMFERVLVGWNQA